MKAAICNRFLFLRLGNTYMYMFILSHNLDALETSCQVCNKKGGSATPPKKIRFGLWKNDQGRGRRSIWEIRSIAAFVVVMLFSCCTNRISCLAGILESLQLVALMFAQCVISMFLLCDDDMLCFFQLEGEEVESNQVSGLSFSSSCLQKPAKKKVRRYSNTARCSATNQYPLNLFTSGTPSLRHWYQNMLKL